MTNPIEEIEYIKAMALSGDKVPFSMAKFVLLGGVVLMFPFPLAFLLASPHSPLASLRQYYPYHEVISLVGISSVILFAAMSFYYRNRLLGLFEASSAARAIRAVWVAVAFAIVVFTSLPRHPSFALLVPTYLIFVAIGWYASGEILKKKAMKLLSLATVLSAWFTSFFVDTSQSIAWMSIYPIDFVSFLIVPAYFFAKGAKE